MLHVWSEHRYEAILKLPVCTEHPYEVLPKFQVELVPIVLHVWVLEPSKVFNLRKSAANASALDSSTTH